MKDNLKKELQDKRFRQKVKPAKGLLKGEAGLKSRGLTEFSCKKFQYLKVKMTKGGDNSDSKYTDNFEDYSCTK